MEVEYEITTDDLYAFQWRAAYKSPIARRARRTVYLLLAVAALLLAILPAIDRDGFVVSRISVVFPLTAFLVVGGLTWIFEKRATRGTIKSILKEEKPGKGQLGTHRLTLTDDGIVERTAVNEQRTSWRGVDRVEENEDYIFIYTSAHAAQVVPKRAFPGAAEARAFYDLAKSRCLGPP